MKKTSTTTDFGEVTEERLEQCLFAAAYIVVTHGRQFGPVFDRLEREMEAFLLAKKNDVIARAQCHLQCPIDRSGAPTSTQPDRSDTRNMDCGLSHSPRFMTDQQLRAYFGLSERALGGLRLTGKFPTRDALINKTDTRAVDVFFDQRSGIGSSPERANSTMVTVDGKENFR